MFSPVYSGSRGQQPVTFLISLTLQCALLAILCSMPVPRAHHPSLAEHDLHSALDMPVYFSAPDPSRPAHPASQNTVERPSNPDSSAAKIEAPAEAKAAPAAEAKLEVPAKPAEPEAQPDASATAEAKPAEAEAQPEANATEAANEPPSEGGLAPFAKWAMNSGVGGQGFMHHKVNPAMPVFTPDPPILHGTFPDPARGKDVVMNVIINDNGSIVQVQVLQGIGYGVENAIVETLRRWIYVPAKVNGVAIVSQEQLRFHFPG
jgi:outer membrane biosynthesis protein TonB